MEDKYTSQDTQLKGNPYGGVTGYRHDLTEYSLIRNTDPYRIILNKWIADNGIKIPAQLWALLSLYNNRIPVGPSPSTDKCDDKWSLLLHFSETLAVLILIDTKLAEFAPFCWQSDCSNIPLINDSLLCDMHHEAINAYLQKIPTIPNITQARSELPKEISIDRYTDVGLTFKQLLRDFTGKEECVFHNFNKSKLDNCVTALSSGQLFQYRQVTILYDGLMNRFLFRHATDSLWHFKCKEAGCFHFAIENCGSCSCHMEQQDYIDIASQAIISLCDIKSWSEMSEDTIAVTCAKIKDVHKGQLQVVKDWKLVCGHNLQLELKPPKGLSSLYLCKGIRCGRWFSRPKHCAKCLSSVYVYKPAISLINDNNRLSVWNGRQPYNCSNEETNRLERLGFGNMRYTILYKSLESVLETQVYSITFSYYLLSRLEGDMIGKEDVLFSQRTPLLGSFHWHEFFGILKRAGYQIDTTYIWEEDSVALRNMKLKFEENQLFSMNKQTIEERAPYTATVYQRLNNKTGYIYVGLKVPAIRDAETASQVKDQIAAMYHRDLKRDVSRYPKIKDGVDSTLALYKGGHVLVLETLLMLAVSFGEQILVTNEKLVNKHVSATAWPFLIFFRELRRAIFERYGATFKITYPDKPTMHIFK